MDRMFRAVPAIFIFLLLALLVYGVIVQTVDGQSKPPTDEKNQEAEVRWMINHGPPAGIQGEVDVSIDGFKPINMYQENRSGQIVKVILGTRQDRPSEYVFLIVGSSEDGTEQNQLTVHNLPESFGSNLRIVGVGRGEDFFLQNDEGNEIVYHVDWSSDENKVSLLKICNKRCG